MVDSAHGITPAGAGKTYYISNQRREKEDHPRRCGENSVRGKPNRMQGRITPAGAGKTGFHGGHRYSAEDHPRRCGENARKDFSAA